VLEENAGIGEEAGSGDPARGLAPGLAGLLKGGASWSPVLPADARPDDGGLPAGASALTLEEVIARASATAQ